MDFSLDARTARLSVGEFSDFTLGPRESSGGPQGIWRAQLGTYWHQQLRAQATSEHGSAAEFEVSIEGRVFHRGWTLTFNGRIDQLLRQTPALTLREIKTVTRPLPVDETELRRDYPSYFAQLATYVALARLGALNSARATLSAQLIFVETASGLAQTLALTSADEHLFRVKLERVTEFLDLRLRARERLRHLAYRPAFATPRPGQETTAIELTAAFERQPALLFEAPTGFGKTGVLLEFALGQSLREDPPTVLAFHPTQDGLLDTGVIPVALRAEIIADIFVLLHGAVPFRLRSWWWARRRVENPESGGLHRGDGSRYCAGCVVS